MSHIESLLSIASGRNDIISRKVLDDLRVDINVSQRDRIFSHCQSKGYQTKWLADGKYVKLNVLGYEDIAEIISDRVLTYIKNFKYDHVHYFLCRVIEDGKYLGDGVYSNSFLKEGVTEISISRILTQYGLSFNISYDDLRWELLDIVGFDIGDYLDSILMLDSIIRNGDRHFGNISFIFDGLDYMPSPIYDNGDALCSDLVTYPVTYPAEDCFKSVMSKPFNSSFTLPNEFMIKPIIDKSILTFIDDTNDYVLGRCKRILELSLLNRSDIEWIER